MKTKIVTIGNSKGVRIPKPLLDISGLDSEVELKARSGEIKIVQAKPAAKKLALGDEYSSSLPILRKDWDRPDEDKAWTSLQ